MAAGLDTALWRFTYDAVVRTGRGPSLREAAEALGTSEPEVRAAYQRIGEGHAILLDASGEGLWRIAPFSAVPTDFAVEASGRGYYANGRHYYYSGSTVRPRSGRIKTGSGHVLSGGHVSRGGFGGHSHGGS